MEIVMCLEAAPRGGEKLVEMEQVKYDLRNRMMQIQDMAKAKAMHEPCVVYSVLHRKATIGMNV
jgi:hypothetical protein